MVKKTTDDVNIELQILQAPIFKEYRKPRSGDKISKSSVIAKSPEKSYSIFDFLEGKVQNMERKTFRLIDKN